jgi:hypothetical protein
VRVYVSYQLAKRQRLTLASADTESYLFEHLLIRTAEPVKNARAYLFRHILLDWSDDDCRKILLNTIASMKPAYSRILVAEPILPPVNPAPYKAMMDVAMIRFEGRGRKERQWRELFDSVGLEVVKIWPGNGYDSIIELRLNGEKN